MTAPLLSVIVPIYNEGPDVQAFLHKLQTQLSFLPAYEIIVVDGGAKAHPLSDNPSVARVRSKPGRALQMNKGAGLARSGRLVFLHCDTHLPEDLSEWFAAWASASATWGFFPVRLSGQGWPLRMIERMISWRSRFSRIGTGDQVQFVMRKEFDLLGGFPEIPLMEDLALSKILRKVDEPFIWCSPVTTSSRRWEKRGIFKTILLMWCLRAAYALGVSPHRLANWYR